MEIFEYVRNFVEFVNDHVQLAIIFVVVGTGFTLLPMEQQILGLYSYTLWSLLLAVGNIIAVYVPAYYTAALFGIDLDLSSYS
jgi:hypothetical protein